MRAVLLRQFGGPEVLHYEEVPTPKPGPGEVMVQVRSVSVNRTLDLKVRQGVYPAKVELPLVLGVDPAGVIAAIGEGVEGFEVGDRAAIFSAIRCGACQYCLAGDESDCRNTRHIGVQRWGGYAEYVVAPARCVFQIPDSLSYAEATVVTRHFPTAFNLLVDKADLKPDEWVLVMGAAGALGACGVQVAKMLGAHVIAAAGADERVRAALSYGADFGVNYRTTDLASEVRRITEGRGVDVVYENIADPTLWPGAFDCLAFRGRLVTAGAHGGGLVELDVKRLYLRRLRIIGTAGGGRRDVLKALEAAGAGLVRAFIGKTMPLREAAEAHRLLDANAILGKIILDPLLA